MIYLDRELVKSGRELLFKEPVYLRENDSDIKIMFNIKNLDIRFKDNKIYYKISIVGENYSYTSEQQFLENGFFILDIPDEVPVGNYMMLISLIDSQFDSIITLNPVNDFIIVEESLLEQLPGGELPSEPEEIKLYLIENNVLNNGEFVKEKENLFSNCTVNNNVITNNGIFNNENIDKKDVYYVTYGTQKEGYIMLICNKFYTSDNKLKLSNPSYYYSWSEGSQSFVYQTQYNDLTFGEKAYSNMVTNSEIAYNYFLEHPEYMSDSIYEKGWSSKKITSCILKWNEILNLSNYNELNLTLDCLTPETIIDPLAIKLKQGNTIIKEVKISELPLADLSINLEDIENKNNVELEIEILGDNTELTIKDLYFKGVIVPKPEVPETENLNYYILKDGVIDENIISYKSNAFGVCSAQINENNLNIVNTGDNPFLGTNWLPTDRDNFYMYGYYDSDSLEGDAFSYVSSALNSSNQFYMYECHQYYTNADGTTSTFNKYYSSVYLNTSSKMRKYFIYNDPFALQSFTKLGYIQDGCEIIYELKGGESTYGATSFSLPIDISQYKNLNLEISEYKCSDMVNNLPGEIILTNSEGNIYKYCLYDCNKCDITIDLSTITNFENIKVDIRIPGCNSFMNIESIYLEPKEVTNE